MISIISLIISFLIMVFTVWNYTKNWLNSRFQIKIKINKIYWDTDGSFVAKYTLVNESSNPISVTGIKLNNEHATNNLISINKTRIINEKLPIHIGAYGALENLSYFEDLTETSDLTSFEITIFTSRGESKDSQELSEDLLLPISQIELSE
ncbi:hypothetical protein [Staphylococcus equorum]|uniref:hypothetical protein n=1 Tax=Staphylococcus equorum TaxID=246432 RepID=UPI003CF30005